MNGRPILTAAEMRAAESTANGPSANELMARAGFAVAEAALRFSGSADTLILCGPGNNGGDGYIAARALTEVGVNVRVAAAAPPSTAASMHARQHWDRPVEPLFSDARPAALLIDALFGTGLTRGLEATVNQTLLRLTERASMTLAVDLPSGVSSDDGCCLSAVPRFDLTVALAALKPAHRLQPAAAVMGRIVVADIGVAAQSGLFEIGKPRIPAPGPDDHKYTRGLVTVLAGAMPGAARLAALGAARSGAGYVQMFAKGEIGRLPAAIVVRTATAREIAKRLQDERIGAIVIGPGLGRDTGAKRVLALALRAERPLVLDADAVGLAARERISVPAILTPHEGEFEAAFAGISGGKVDRARAAARLCGAVVLIKGADTVIAAPDGRAAIAPPGSAQLSTAGSGDVLAGACGTMLAQLGDPFAAACAAAWLHAAASRSLSGPFIADDLAAALPGQVARCR